MSVAIKYRIGKSRGFMVLTTVLAFTCVLPLLFILFYILKAGLTKINWNFITNLPKPVGEVGGGIANALLGSLVIIGVACLIAIPFGILCGIYLSENKKSRLAYWARLCVDVLQGVPSIVIGIVAYFWLVTPKSFLLQGINWLVDGMNSRFHLHMTQWGGFSAISGSFALAIMMLPIIIRSTEETLLLLPDSLREASYALGMPFHRVILKVIIPCGISGILSGVMLSVARIAGETAPLLFTAFGNPYLSSNLLKPMQSLPLLIFNYAISPYNDWKDLAWGASCILLIMVLLLNILTKIMTRKWKVQL